MSGQIDYEKKYKESSKLVEAELIRAKSLYPKPYANQHEAYAVILEELDELWDEIKKKQSNYDIDAQRKEAVQLAAMAHRFIIELT